ACDGLSAPDSTEAEPAAVCGSEESLSLSMFDASDPQSLGQVVTEIVRIGSIARDRLSHDTWRAIHRIHEHFVPSVPSGVVPADEALELLNQLIIDVSVCSGLIGDGMVRGPAWRFLDMGRRIERSLQTCRLIGGALLGADDPSVAVLWALLDVMDSRMTYRSRYLAAVRTVPVLDLLIADETNPRSLAFQIAALSEHLGAMPQKPNAVGLNAEQKCIAAALYELRMTDLQTLVESAAPYPLIPAALNALMYRQQTAVSDLSDLLSRKYLVHSGAPHPLHDDADRSA
ncbi:MAG: alpha-E domain-containing protein, partial [Planctomycetaceae bacterium]|nr:alpha-E domain-containing protein [Planctomycetaceae bacterium]